MDFDPARHRPKQRDMVDADLFLDQLPPADAKGVPGNDDVAPKPKPKPVAKPKKEEETK